jgi:hypothetical protein
MSNACADAKLIFAADLIRHGDRTPIIEIPKSPYHWPQGLGELTAEGMQQEYQLGGAMRKKYVQQYHLLPMHYQVATLYVRSTDENRALTSAESFLLGLYPLKTGPSLQNSKKSALPFAYQPIPIHTVAKNTDSLLRVNNTLGETSQTQSINQLKKQFQVSNQQLQHWQEISGLDLTNPYHFILLGDNLFIRQLHHVPLPKGMSAQEASTIITLSNIIFVNAFRNRDLAYPTGHVFLTSLDAYFKQVHAKSSPLRYVLFSAHDSTLMSVMTTLGVPMQKALRYASDLNFLLLQDKQDYYVKVFLNDQPVHIPKCGGNTCTLAEFSELAQMSNDD